MKGLHAFCKDFSYFCGGELGLVAAMQEYSNQKEFLSVVAEHATYQKMREAANIMMAVQECQTAYR